MLFNSLSFAFYLIVVFILYWFVANRYLKFQNALLLAASYFFYGFWDWRFLFLLFGISFLNYATGLFISIAKSKKISKIWLVLGLITNISVLVYFKYFNFFVDGFISLFKNIGLNLEESSLNIILPLGISFYVFLSISYIIDIYRKKLIANHNIIEVLLSLSFFPIILAGPIQRPITLLPQIQQKRVFKYEMASDGMRQILWGLFMKVVIADNCAIYVNEVFDNYTNYSGSTLLVGGFLYTIQIYADFAGYSEIAIGVSKLLGFKLMRNFAFPYFARDISEFWKRWHISLTTWFRDYVFLPIAYSFSRKMPEVRYLSLKTDLLIYIIGISITWLFTGLWHGANFTFVVWGLMHAFLLIIFHSQKKARKRLFKQRNISKNSLGIVLIEYILTLFYVVIAWIIFRSDSLQNGFSYLSGIFDRDLFSIPYLKSRDYYPFMIFNLSIFFIFEWVNRNRKHGFEISWIKSFFLRYPLYILLIILIFWFGTEAETFIYFQF